MKIELTAENSKAVGDKLVISARHKLIEQGLYRGRAEFLGFVIFFPEDQSYLKSITDIGDEWQAEWLKDDLTEVLRFDDLKTAIDTILLKVGLGTISLLFDLGVGQIAIDSSLSYSVQVPSTGTQH